MQVTYIDHMGDDLSVVNDARVSFDKKSEWEKVDCGHMDCGPECRGYTIRLADKDAKLIGYLARNNHWTPFAGTSIKFQVGAPIPIRTQCYKHKIGFNENEESRRYITSTPVLFIPDEFRMAAENVKQGSGGTHPHSASWKLLYKTYCYRNIQLYENMIADGVAPEQARFVLPQGVIVNWRWTGSLAAYARFYKQRTDPHVQRETQIIAEKIGAEIEKLFPVSWKALTGGVK